MSTDQFGDLDSELIEEFVQESMEMLDEVEPTLLDLERSRAEDGSVDRESLDLIFRAFHSMKGSGGFLGMKRLVSVTHAAENLLDELREGAVALVTDHVNILCDAMDFSRDALGVIRNTLTDEPLAERAGAMAAAIEGVVEACRAEAPGLVDAPAAPAPAPAAPAPAPDAPVAAEAVEEPGGEAAARAPLPKMPFFDFTLPPQQAPPGSSDDAAVAGAPAEVSEASSPPPQQDRMPFFDFTRPPAEEPPAPAAQDQLAAPPRERPAPAPRPPRRPLAVVPAEPQRPVAPQHAAKATPARADAGDGHSQSRATIRVDVAKLDALMNLVGELILAENAVTHHKAVEMLDEEEAFHRAAMHLNRVTRSLQDIAMSVRMLPIAGTFRKMQRLVRDLTRKQGKDVVLELTGEGTEVDKNLIEGIADPLVHIMRNAIDHGIEPVEERVAAGKPEQGSIVLGAEHRGGEVWITVQDDGKGIDTAKIVAKAVERGVIPPDAQPSEQEAYSLLFEPGFSTADKVTSVSGRGVGMDVVRRNIEALNGRIDVSSRVGVGTTFTLRIPLTLAIIDGMLVQVGDRRYTIPLLSIQESVTMSRGAVMVLPDGRELARIRQDFLPVVRLSRLHGIQATTDPYAEGILVAVQSGHTTFALHVDRLLGQRQTVIKALPDYLSHLKGLAGCSILSNGEISLIVDLANLAEHAPSLALAC